MIKIIVCNKYKPLLYHPKPTNKNDNEKPIFILLAVLLVGSCRYRKQDEDTLPPATQEGKNTGGALMDGKVLLAKIA